MEQKQQEVMIKLHTEIDDDGQKETLKEHHHGTCFIKEEKAILTYTDKKNELGKVKNLITIDPEKLSVKRSGAVSMQQIFLVDKLTECMYKHPYGNFLMEIKTTALEVNPFIKGNNSGKVVVEYDMLFQETNRHHKLTLEFTEVQ